MADYHDLVQALTWLLVNKLQNKSEYTRGLLGNGQGHVEVPGRPDYTYVRPDRFTTRVAEVFNKSVAGPDGLPVILGELPWSPGLTQVLSVDWDTYLGVGWGDATPGITKHGQTHAWRDGAPGVDAFNVYRRQMGELRCYPVGSGSTSIYVSPYNFTHMEQLKSWSGLPGLDLAGAVPSSSGTARMALVYWDPCSGTSGWLGVATGTLGVDAAPEILNRPAAPAGTIPSAWVRLAGGQGGVTEFDIWDARPLWMPSLEFATGSCGIWAGLIPIGDPGNHFTGSTVESALDELGASGGGAPSGPAGGDLTGTYPNPLVVGLWGYPLVPVAPDEGDVLMFSGSAWQAIPDNFWKTGNTIVLSDSGKGDYHIVPAVFTATAGGDVTILVDTGTYISDGETVPDFVSIVARDPVNCLFDSSNSAITLNLGSSNHVANLRIRNQYNAAAGYCIDVPGTSADIPTLHNLDLLQIGHADGYCMRIAQDVNIDTCRMFSLNGGGILMAAGGTAYVFGGKIESDPSSVAINNLASGTVYLFGNPLIVGGVSGPFYGQYVDENGDIFTGIDNFFDLEERASAPSSPAAARRRIYVKPSGTFTLDQYGVEYGPLEVGGSPTGPAGGDLTGTYPNPTVDGLLNRPLGLNPVDEYYMLMYTGSAWQPVPGPFKLVAPDGAPDPALYSDNSGNVIGSAWISGDAFGFPVENRASGTVSAGDLGYIDAQGYFARTATAYADVSWAVVLQGGGHQQDIRVTRHGRVTVTLNGNCSAGDLLYTSTTAGRAQPLSTVRPELFARALTANAAGAGGTCEALLLCQTRQVPLALADSVYQINATAGGSDSDWNGTIDSLPGGAAVRYDTVSGDERNLRPNASTHYGKLRLYNSSADPGEEYALISDNDPTGGAGYDGEITLTAAVPASWLPTHPITIRSQTNTSTVGSSYFLDLELTGTDIPALTRILEMEWKVKDTAAGDEKFKLHPWEANDNAKRVSNQSQVANQEVPMSGVKIIVIQGRFCVLWSGSGAGTARFELKPTVAHVASP